MQPKQWPRHVSLVFGWRETFRRGQTMGHEGFLRAIRAEPEDEALRLIYADWLEENGDPRGEFIRLQCELTRWFDPVQRIDKQRELEWFRCSREKKKLANNDQYHVLTAREQELLSGLEQTWVGPLWELIGGWSDKRTYRRGFVEIVQLTHRDFITHASMLFEWCPLIRTLTLSGDSGPDCLAEALASRYMAWVEHLDLGAYFWLQDDHLSALASSPHLSHLKTLRIGDGMGEGGVLSEQAFQLIAQAPLMSRLTTLVLEHDSYLGRDREREAEVDKILGRAICLVDPCN
jgi:uncharacterized protein (TIGR02996 family)